jgi:Cu2+-exporting ATPase
MSSNIDYSNFVNFSKNGEKTLSLNVENIHCISCVQRIESALNNLENVNARVNLSQKKLIINWQGETKLGNNFAKLVEDLGYKIFPFNKDKKDNKDNEELKFLLRCLAVAAFASGNLMIITDALWFSSRAEMGSSTRDLLNLLSAVISLPVIVYSGRPFFYSAWSAIKKFHTNMDVPISLAIILAAIVSVSEALRRAEHVYFDSSVMLIFFLLIGRYLDKKMRSKAKSAAEDLLSMVSGNATIFDDGEVKLIAVSELKSGMVLQVAKGEKILADGYIIEGNTEIDTSLLTGETFPRIANKQDKVFAGMINLLSPIKVKVTGEVENSMIAEIVKMLEKAEQSNSKYVKIADKVAALYTPVVHVLAIVTFIAWLMIASAWQDALIIATTVLIITCPCAMGLAVPVVQVIASSRLFKNGMLIKSSSALEKLSNIEAVIFDKTGTLTFGKPVLANQKEISNEILKLAASIAVKSQHPLSKAVYEVFEGDLYDLNVEEISGNGLISSFDGIELKLGKSSFCNVKNNGDNITDNLMELWFIRGHDKPVRFKFYDKLRPNAKEVVNRFKEMGILVHLLSGDRKEVVETVANELGISNYRSNMLPMDKANYIKELNKKTLMIGDGLNDAVALKTANISISPSSAIDITQNSADIVFRGDSLYPIIKAYDIAKFSNKLIKENFSLSIIYNVLAVPFAMMGYVTPLIAAVAMSSSSIMVVLNSLRLNIFKGKKWIS